MNGIVTFSTTYSSGFLYSISSSLKFLSVVILLQDVGSSAGTLRGRDGPVAHASSLLPSPLSPAFPITSHCLVSELQQASSEDDNVQRVL